jgi:tetratricopeptide (TPR) repeat protein
MPRYGTLFLAFGGKMKLKLGMIFKGFSKDGRRKQAAPGEASQAGREQSAGADCLDTAALGEKLANQVPILYFLVSHQAPYSLNRRWGDFDQLGLRAIDDLAFEDGQKDKTIAVFSSLPPDVEGCSVASVPTVVALERIFFHLQEVQRIEVNPRTMPQGVAHAQRSLAYSLPEVFDEPYAILRSALPELLGRLSTEQKDLGSLVQRAEQALRDNLLFECFYLARTARRQGGEELQKAWFLELWSFSFLGLPEEALALYEEYADRGSPEPLALLLSGRYRLLLKQLNEARTILHTLTFMPEVGARAECELARSFLSGGEFARAVDLATAAIKRDEHMLEGFLVRGIAQRGLAYSSGDEEGLREALSDFERVATAGGFHAPEASFHAGTIFARMGDLEAAERSLRQSLFQRDRFSTRDALIRVLAAANKWKVARDECDVLLTLASQATKALAEELRHHSAQSQVQESSENVEPAQDLWSPVAAQACAAALQKLHQWRIPVSGRMTDLILLDDFINRFAPAGEFIAEGEFASLSQEKLSVVARVFALHIGHILQQKGMVVLEEPVGRKVKALITSDGQKLHVEAFVDERILLGAAGDNISSLESLLADVGQEEVVAGSNFLPTWWVRADEGHLAEIRQISDEAKKSLQGLGAVLNDTLMDLEEIDRVIDQAFEPGGKTERAEFAEVDAVARFVVGVGLMIGSLIDRHVPSTWFFHPQPEGISLFNTNLGRLFPVARVQRRIYLASAADYSAKLASLALGAAAAAVATKVQAGEISGHGQAKESLLALLPSLSSFSEDELNLVVRSLQELTAYTAKEP